MSQLRRAHGFTLLEVLIALLIFSLGLMGLAGLLVIAVKTNHSAYMRTQASFLAQGMADRMRANSLGVWRGSYQRASAPAVASTPGACTNTVPCGAAAVAARDLAAWANQLVAFLPNPTAAINCTTAAAAVLPTAGQLLLRPPYAGTCDITLRWNESSLNTGTQSQAETLDWVFEP